MISRLHIIGEYILYIKALKTKHFSQSKEDFKKNNKD